jgi:hypothetical protein
MVVAVVLAVLGRDRAVVSVELEELLGVGVVEPVAILVPVDLVHLVEIVVPV